MPVLMIAEVPNLTEEIYAGMIGQLSPRIKPDRRYFPLHTAVTK